MLLEVFADIFLNYNVQFCHLLKKPKRPGERAMKKMAKDSVHRIFDQLANEEFEIFDKELIIDCFLKGKSKGSFFDKIRNKLPKVLSGKSLGGKLKHSESKNNFSTQDLFEIPLGTINNRS